MDDFLEQTAVRRKQGPFTLLYYLAWMVMVVFGIIGAFGLTSILAFNPEGGVLFNPVALGIFLVFGALAFLMYRLKDECRVEYDYSFTNGSLDVSRIMNQSRRRYLCALETKEVLSCGPAAGPAFQKVLREPGLKQHNWFLNREARLYYFYFQKKGVKHMAVMELNDEMISVIRSKKYLQMGVWHDADGNSTYASIS